MKHKRGLKMKNTNKIIKGLVKDFTDLISKDRINEIARKSKFVQRDSGKMTGETFFELAIFDNINLCTESLEALSTFLFRKKNIEITSQALDERFNEKSVAFLKTVFNEMIMLKASNSFGINTAFTSHFNRIQITDSSIGELPTSCKSLYKGYGGNAAESAVKVQFTFDIKSGNIGLIDVGDVTNSDGGYLKTLDKSREKNDLEIKDLGYYSIKNFDKIAKEGSFYLSRLKVGSLVYVINPNPDKFATGNIKKSSEYIKLDLKIEAGNLKPGEIKEIKVFAGEDKVECRLILNRLPEEAVAKKLENQKKIARKKQIEISDNSIDLSIVNMYITNVSADILPKEIVYLIYSIRWQIEIIFKVLKSVFAFDKVKAVKQERIDCHLYSTLIRILLSSKIVFSVRNSMYLYEEREISEYKAFNTVVTFFDEIKNALFHLTLDLENLFERIVKAIYNNGMKSINKNKKTVLAILKL